MPKNSFAEITNDTKTMLSGLKANAAAVGKRGLDLEFINRLENTMETLNALDNEQEKLKAKLKTKTTELDSGMETLKEMLAESKKVVKMSIDQAGWREFGIEDTK